MKKYRKYLLLLLLLGAGLLTALLLIQLNDRVENNYVNVIPETLSVQEGDVFDLAIDSNLNLSVLNIVSSSLDTVRLDGDKLRAIKGGTAFITVQSQDGSVQDQVLITVNPLVTSEPAEDLSFEIVIGDERLTFDEPVQISQLEPPLREGFTFVGFSLEENGSVIDSDLVIDESLTLYSVYQAVEEETPEPPVVDEEDTEDEDDSDEDPEEPDDELSESTPSSITVTLESDQGITMSVLTVSSDSIISAEDFDTGVSDVGYFLKGQTCENPFDFDTPLVTNTSIVFGEMNYTSPCIKLDEMATLGNLQVGETIEAFVSPSAATITYEWFISENDRDYLFIRNVTGSTLEILPEHFRKYIAVKLTGTGDYTGSLSLPLGRVGLSSDTAKSSFLTGAESAFAKNLIANGIVPIATVEDFLAIGSTDEHNFAQLLVTEGGVSKSYGLIRNIDFDSLGSLSTSLIEGALEGELNGNNFSLLNLTINAPSSSEIGVFENLDGGIVKNITVSGFNILGGSNVGTLFGDVLNDSVVQNILIVDSFIEGTNYVGGLFGTVEETSTTTIKNITLKNSNVTGTLDVGGLAGYIKQNAEVDVNNVSSSSVNIHSSTDNAGGLFGLLENSTVTLSSISISGSSVEANDYSGGLIGYIQDSVTEIENITIKNSNFYGTNQVGGITGEIKGANAEVNLNNIVLSGVNVQADLFAGGLFGKLDSATVSLTAINISGGSVEAKSTLGGLIGFVIGASVDISQAIQGSNIVSTEPRTAPVSNIAMGGLIGQIYNDAQVHINQTINRGDVSASGNGIGGFVGQIYDENDDNPLILTITDSYNIGNIEGVYYIGGLIGKIENRAVFTDIRNSYNTGNVAGDSRIGGIIGRIEDNNPTITLTGVYYLTGTAVNNVSIGSVRDNPTINGTSTPLSRSNMALVNTFINAGWNITDASVNTTTWSIGFNGDYTYPYLTFQGDPFPEQIPSLSESEISTISKFSYVSNLIINEGFVPIASFDDFVNIGFSKTNTIFAENTIYEDTFETSGLDGKYIIVQDIDLSSHVFSLSIIDGTFKGELDGNGFVLSNLSINDASGENNMGGLFKKVEDATVSNLTIDSFIVSRSAAVAVGTGLIAGESDGATTFENITIANSTLSAFGTHIEQMGVGGLIGRDYSHTAGEFLIVSGYAFSGVITGGGMSVGGVVGQTNGATTLSGITINGLISGNEQVGGLIGNIRAEHLDIFNSINSASVYGNENVGGFIGKLIQSETTIVQISQSISAGKVTAIEYMGGFVGSVASNNDVDLTIDDSYVMATIERIGDEFNGWAGGFIGNIASSKLTILNSYSSANMKEDGCVNTCEKIDMIVGDIDQLTITSTNVYYNSDIGSISSSSYTQTPVGFSVGDRTSESTFTGFDFTNTWAIDASKNSSYPYLKWSVNTISE